METGDACGWDSCEYLPPMIHISVCFGIDRSPHDLPGRSIDGRRCAYIHSVPDQAGWLIEDYDATFGNEPKNDGCVQLVTWAVECVLDIEEPSSTTSYGQKFQDHHRISRCLTTAVTPAAMSMPFTVTSSGVSFFTLTCWFPCTAIAAANRSMQMRALFAADAIWSLDPANSLNSCEEKCEERGWMW